MAILIDFNDLKFHKEDEDFTIEEVMCVKCLHRWIGVLPEGTLLKNVECPKCRKQGYSILTGQSFGELV